MSTRKLDELIVKLLNEGPHGFASASGRRVRILFNNCFIVDTTQAVHVWEHPRYPFLYVPYDDIKQEVKDDMMAIGNLTGDNGEIVHVLQHPIEEPKDGRCSKTIVFFAQDCGKLTGLVRFEFGEMDQWYEEDVPIYVHPKDPTKRIDILHSTRPIEIRLDGNVLAKSNSSLHLIEPLLPVRYYLPPTSVDPSILRESNLKTRCPYKGEAGYYHVLVGEKRFENLIWFYRYPAHDCAAIAGALCFYNEKVEVWLDGKRV